MDFGRLDGLESDCRKLALEYDTLLEQMLKKYENDAMSIKRINQRNENIIYNVEVKVKEKFQIKLKQLEARIWRGIRYCPRDIQKRVELGNKYELTYFEFYRELINAYQRSINNIRKLDHNLSKSNKLREVIACISQGKEDAKTA